MMDYTIFEPILDKEYFSIIASRATPIGSAERIPDDIS
jgi:hypothetical protein